MNHTQSQSKTFKRTTSLELSRWYMGIVLTNRYATLMHSIILQAQAASSKGVPAEEAGRVTADAITSKRPRTRYTVGREAALLPLLAILPDRMLDRILAAALRPHVPKENK